MKFFIKLNGVSALYALLLFIIIELMGNIYRISRITSWEIETVNMVVLYINIVVLIVFTILMVFIIRNWMESRKSTYWSVLLWFPYFMLYIEVFVSLFPIQNRGEIPNPGIGLLAFGIMMIYPLYIVLVNLFGLEVFKKKTS